MRVEELLQRIGATHSVRRVFGEPLERDGVTVIPVAAVLGGGGIGESSDDSVGGGYGVWARGIGVYTISGGQVRFVPATDRTLLVVAGLFAATRIAAAHVRRRGTA